MADAPLFQIDGLRIAGERGSSPADALSLRIDEGDVHALLVESGGAGSMLAASLLGSPDLRVTAGRILLRGDEITTWPTDVRAKAGLFLARADRPQIAGVTLLGLLGQIGDAHRGIGDETGEIHQRLRWWMNRLEIDPAILEQRIDDLPSGEGWQSEILQLALSEPVLAIIDQPGPDVEDAAATCLAAGIRAVRGERPSLGTLVVTQSRQLVDHLEADHVHVMADGRIVASGGPELARQPDTEGYESFT